MIVSLVGDYNASVTAHQAIPGAIEIAANALELDVDCEWIRSKAIDHDEIAESDAIWCVPASPYEDPLAVIESIRIARENDIPFLGTCGGYQHAALEYARNVLGYSNAASAEEDPDTSMPLINALSCRLADASGEINLQAGTKIAEIYARPNIVEEYNCGFGVNRKYLSVFDNSELRFSAFDVDGDPRGLEIPQHRFFIGVAFQPERSSIGGKRHPLIEAFLEATV